jgi:hypothetical protein
VEGGAPICRVVGVDPSALLKRGRVAASGTGWSSVAQIGGFYYASFTSFVGEHCKAFAKLQLPYYQLRGWLCAREREVPDSDIQALANAMIVRVTE